MTTLLITNAKSSELNRAWALVLAIMSIVFTPITPAAKAQEVPPVLEFPQMGVDDMSTYRGYATRFFRDSAGNTIQISISQKTGRVVHIWADAVNESIAFTARDTTGQPAKLMWDRRGAELFSEGQTRYVQYTLLSDTPALDVGLFVLGSMRIERDVQYLKRHLLPFDSEPFIPKELIGLIDRFEQLPGNVRNRHMALLQAQNLKEIRSRLTPQIKRPSQSLVLVEQPTLDGKNDLSLVLKVDRNQATIDVVKDKISIHSLLGQPIQLTIKVGTDSPALTPLWRDEIFNRDFMKFYEHARVEYDSIVQEFDTAKLGVIENERLLRFKRLDRQVKSLELLSTQEKLMAGLPNFATYFGRDMMMSALMLEPVWTPAMLEHVIASVLRKLTSTGEVSHEEGLGGQAIRENAAEYNKLISEYLRLKGRYLGDANKILAKAEKVLGNLQRVTENYRMLDDDFQLPVLAARYLSRPDIPDQRKHAFLQARSGRGDATSRLTLLLGNLLYVSQSSRPYVEHPVAENLVGFPKLDGQRWLSGSWRDSGAGYANGRFAMDINAIWVPKALASIETIFAALGRIGISLETLENSMVAIRGTRLLEYARNSEALQQALDTWRHAVRHFEVHLSAPQVQQRVRAKLNGLPEEERTYWENVISKSGADKERIEFLALSLDEKGQPIRVANTDVATWFFLEDFTSEILSRRVKPEEVIKWLRIFVMPYPVGLFLEGVGPAVANDVYASPEVWENFRRDIYHSPSVVWGREVNLLFLGITKQILSAYDSQGRIKDARLDPYVEELRVILDKILTAVERSGLKHNELWRYRIESGVLLPKRYATTSDIQLWNLTDLAVQYLLERLKDMKTK